MTGQTRFVCNAVDVFDLAGLPGWIRSERDAGHIPAGGGVAVEIVHRDREMDGSCRWCGCRSDEVIDFEEGRLRE